MSIAVCRTFFDALYGDSITKESQIVIWSPGLPTQWCDSIELACEESISRASETDTYFGFSLQDPVAVLREAARIGDNPVLTGRRGYASTAIVVPGIALDFDHDTPARGKKKCYPPDRESILGLVARMPLEPTFMVATGGGIHAYWLFREPFLIESDEERQRVAGTMRGWNALARMESQSLGWEIDSVYDLARVLRAPGTTNRKPCFGPDGSLVAFFGTNGEKRYNLDEFDPFVTLPDTARKNTVRIELKGILYDEEANPLPELLEQSLLMQPQFADVWKRRRTFPSQSEADFSLAFWGLKLGWANQEIVNLIIAHRRGSGAKLKIRPDYFEKTISNAGSSIAEFARSGDDMKHHAETMAARAVEPAEARPKLCAEISKMISMPEHQHIRRVVKFGGDPPDYRLEIEDGSSIALGAVDSILKPWLFQSKIAAAINHLIFSFTKTAWEPIAQAILLTVEHVELPETSKPIDAIREYLREYLDETELGEDQNHGCQYRQPYAYENGIVAIFLRSFRGWLDAQSGKIQELRGLDRILWQIGCRKEKVRYTRLGPDKKQATRSIYLVPMDVIPAKAKTEENGHAKQERVESSSIF